MAGAKEGMGLAGQREPEQAHGSGALWPPQREAGLQVRSCQLERGLSTRTACELRSG